MIGAGTPSCSPEYSLERKYAGVIVCLVIVFAENRDVLPRVTPAKAGVQERCKNLDSGPVFQRGKLKAAGMTESCYIQSNKTFGNWCRTLRAPLQDPSVAARSASGPRFTKQCVIDV